VIETEILITGAGPAGATTAMALAGAGISCLLVDKAVFPRDKICGDALSGKVVLSLSRLGVDLPVQLTADKHYMHSHGVTFIAPNGKALSVPFRKNADDVTPPGFIARRFNFDNWLFEKAKHSPGVNVETGLELEKFEHQDGYWLVYDKDNTPVIKARLIIAADGAHSRFVRNVLRVQQEDRHFCAGLRVYYKGVSNLNGDGFIELHFLKDVLPGYFWIFPLPGGAANVGLGIRSDVIRKKKMNIKKILQDIISNDPQIAPRFVNASAEGPVQGYGLPLGSARRPLSGEGYLLLGDAGSLIDPFTGEGIGNAMISGLKAAEVVVKNFSVRNFSAPAMAVYDTLVYKRLGSELRLSEKMQQLVNYPWLFNLVANKANRSQTLRETISCMFDDIELRGKLKDPRFYFKILLE
jgi:menaquinone-9 beta-reductase